MPGQRFTYTIERLDDAWVAAARQAAAKKLTAYGVLVARAEAGDGFLVLAAPDSPEDRFTAATCRPGAEATTPKP